MNHSVLMPIEELLRLKENEPLRLLEVSLEKKGTNENPKLSLQIEAESDYIMLISPFIDDIVHTLKESLKVVDMERILVHSENVVPYAYIQLFVNENGVNVGSRFYQIEESELIEKGKELHSQLNHFLDNMLEYINTLVDDYAEMKDNEQTYSPREFTFIYRKVNSEWKYDSFVRMTDRLISEQKREINGLLSKGIDEKLVTIVNANTHVSSNNMQIKFYSDGLSVNGFEVAGYDYPTT